MLASGALHEDGLGDMVDGFGGGRTRERKLEIMRDSRIGSYGAAALLFSILLYLIFSVLASLLYSLMGGRENEELITRIGSGRRR